MSPVGHTLGNGTEMMEVVPVRAGPNRIDGHQSGSPGTQNAPDLRHCDRYIGTSEVCSGVEIDRTASKLSASHESRSAFIDRSRPEDPAC